jgi:FtsP/CotA-like multicopper oxidase with cupredoxin domain
MCTRASHVTGLLRVLVVTLIVTRAAFAVDDAAPAVPGLGLAVPHVLVSRHGELHVDLTAAPGEYIIDGERFEGMLYNDAYIPPVWRLKPGDTLTVALHNRLQQPASRVPSS